MKTSFRQRVLIAVGISVGLLASLNLFGQNTYTIQSQSDYQVAVNSIHSLAGKIYDAHVKHPSLAYSHVYNQDGSLMGFSVTGVSTSSEADQISASLMELELLGNAIKNMDLAYLPTDNNEKLNSRVSKKKAMQNTAEQDALMASIHPSDVIASSRR